VVADKLAALQTLAVLVQALPAVEMLVVALSHLKLALLELMVLVIMVAVILETTVVAVVALVQWAALEILAATQLALEALVNNGQMVLSMLAAVRARAVTLIPLVLAVQVAEVEAGLVFLLRQIQAEAAEAEMTLGLMVEMVVLVL
jgi:hypothetical protein